MVRGGRREDDDEAVLDFSGMNKDLNGQHCVVWCGGLGIWVFGYLGIPVGGNSIIITAT